ncbi:Alpha-D-kanosaminyltransferase [Fundidesulfovibrio magnetotacticus]|uniref:Alpha-D-kanosaminyltransferase n=1 Tax=Fundidesulfovibrio magnetotacticus TaxID=2730080 RepID=A0A6V8LPI4_9BACT|nr:glycosyltransferase family 4 protein [Fundidesulfovibrio magnetotacticus]GFK92441.1 Alpha-D-kanosaminyltransferase [Fundidesulfovibrio magnetotacticus]
MSGTAYVTLWYPKPSETFVVGEVAALRELGMPVTVYTLYGRLRRNVSKDMETKCAPVHRLGCASILSILASVRWWWKNRPDLLRATARKVLVRFWRDLEQTGENAWAFLAGCHLARLFTQAGVEHIHAGWANGPATAAWTASLLTGIPFSFTGRAGDIYPPDGALEEKIADAKFVRTDAGFNVDYLRQFTWEKKDRVHLVRNMLSWDVPAPAELPMREPFRLLAIGRFVKTKGFDVLLDACGLLRERGVDFRLTLAGSGAIEGKLRAQAKRLGIEDKVEFPGFILHRDVPELIGRHDIFVMPSKISATGDRDGLPTVIMEALVSRVPVVATDVGGIREVIETGETGILIQQKNPKAMAEAILKLAADRDEAVRMAENGKARVLDFYDTARNARSFHDLITQ